MISPESVGPTVREYLAAAIAYIREAAEEDPSQTVSEVLERQDVRDMVGATFGEARSYVIEALLEDWAEGGGEEEAVLNHLLGDVDRLYGGFTPAHAARRLHDEGEKWARTLALRSMMAVQHAARYSAQTAVLERAEQDDPGQFKRWKAHPENPACCFWCRRLHGVTIPLRADFGPYLGGPAILSSGGRVTHPPKTYHGKLLAPPLHPWCECELEIVSPGGARVPSAGAGEGLSALPFLASSDIRAMPSAKYRLLIEYLRAAAHELGLVLRRLRRA